MVYAHYVKYKIPMNFTIILGKFIGILFYIFSTDLYIDLNLSSFNGLLILKLILY